MFKFVMLVSVFLSACAIDSRVWQATSDRFVSPSVILAAQERCSYKQRMKDANKLNLEGPIFVPATAPQYKLDRARSDRIKELREEAEECMRKEGFVLVDRSEE